MREAGDPSSESIMSQRLEDLGLRLVSERPAASGAGTDVYRATASSPWEREGRRVNDVALQVLKRRDELPGTWDDHRRRFLYERATLARVQASPHVLALFEEGTWDGRPAMVVEWCKAGRLKTWLEALPTAPSLVRQLSLQLLDALADAHAGGVIHRGIRPDAVLLRTGRDIALAYFVEPDEDELGSVYEGVAGSRRYMAPEQFDEPDRVSPSTDVFSAACLIFEMATGHHPFDHLVDGDGLHALSPYAGDARPRLEPLADVPSGAALAPVLAPALQVDPGSRLDSVELLRRRLAESAYGAEAQVTEAVEHIGLAAATGSAPQRRRRHGRPRDDRERRAAVEDHAPTRCDGRRPAPVVSRRRRARRDLCGTRAREGFGWRSGPSGRSALEQRFLRRRPDVDPRAGTVDPGHRSAPRERDAGSLRRRHAAYRSRPRRVATARRRARTGGHRALAATFGSRRQGQKRPTPR